MCSLACTSLPAGDLLAAPSWWERWHPWHSSCDQMQGCIFLIKCVLKRAVKCHKKKRDQSLVAPHCATLLQTPWTLNWLCPPNPSRERCLAHSNVICVSLCRSPIHFLQTASRSVSRCNANACKCQPKKKNGMPSLHHRKAHSLLSQLRYGAHAAMLALYDLSCVANLLWPGYGACRL